jgi:hypothetical protein
VIVSPIFRGTTLKICTYNVNGFTQTANIDEMQTMWDFARTEALDVLILIDHRCNKNKLDLIHKTGKIYLAKDIAMQYAECYQYPLNHQFKDIGNEWSRAVGGVAIFAIGDMAPYLQHHIYKDPSGCGSSLIAPLRFSKEHAPIFLSAFYNFECSPGPTTLSTRTQQYLKSQCYYENSAEWNLLSFVDVLEETHNHNINSPIFIGGDFNHTDWSSKTSLIHRFHEIGFRNKCYQANKRIHGPYISTRNEKHSPSWIDHILLLGKPKLLGYSVNSSHQVTTNKGDHLPFIAEFSITKHKLSTFPKNLATKVQFAQRALTKIVNTKKEIHINFFNDRILENFPSPCESNT